MKEQIEAMARAYQEVKQGAILESHFKVGDEVKCKASGMEGEVVKVDPEGKGKYYTVKRDDGKMMKYAPNELELEDEDEEEDMKEAKLDPVGQADADINNDGRVNSTDKYLHKRRKAIGKAMKKGKDDTATMNPKMSEKTTSESMKSADKKPEEYTDEKGRKRTRMVPVDKEVTKESMSIRDKLMSVLEKKDHGNTEQKQAYDDNWSPGAKQMKADLGSQIATVDGMKAAEQTAQSIANSVKAAPGRTNDNKAGDTKVVNPVDDVTKKGGMKESFSQTVRSISDAYQSMYAPKVEENTEIMEDAEKHKKMAADHKEKMLDAKEEDHRDGITAHRLAHDAHMAAAKAYDKAPDSHTATKAKIAGQKAMDHSKKANSVFN